MPPKSWAKLTMFDRARHRMRALAPGVDRLLREARPFVVTDAAAERVGDAMASYPELLADNGAFAIPPFPVMWIEFPNRIMLRHPLVGGALPPGDTTADSRVGYLFSTNTVLTFAEREDMQPEILPLSYTLNRPMPLDEQQVVADWFGVSRIGLDPFLWGHTLHPTLDPKRQRALRAQHTLELSDGLLRGHATADDRHVIMRGMAGELRNILALLLMINQPAKVIQTTEVPRQRGLVRGQPSTYWGHSVIDINLDGKRLLTRPKGASNWHVRWHEVRGHFVHRHARDDHAHVWVADPEHERRWRCGVAGCEAMRTWREYPGGRGSAAVGLVDQTRRIRAE